MKKRICACLDQAPGVLALLCALFMLVVLPLSYHDAFFDINRFKVQLVQHVVPPLAVMTGLSLFARALCRRRIEPVCSAALPMHSALAFFLAACVLSYAVNGLDEAMLTGSQGRYSGLLLWLCCGAAYAVISRGVSHIGVLLAGMGVGIGFCAALGIANALGFDPLHFYDEIKASQKTAFVSTIGNVDFFGAYIALFFPIFGAQMIFAKGRIKRLCAALPALLCAGGIAASRSDCAFAAMHLSCAVLLALAGADWRAMARALLLCACGFLALPLMGEMLRRSPLRLAYNGAMKMIAASPIVPICTGVFALGALLCILLSRRGVSAPGRKRMLLAVGILIAACAALSGALAVYFTVAAPDVPLGQAEGLLRFSDAWGSRRGFVYTRALRAYADFDALHKLAGGGLDMAQTLMTPYFDNPKMLAYGVFNDVHNQPLQYLLTTGLLGFAGFVGFHLLSMRTAWVHAGQQDALLCGLSAALAGYTLIALLNVSQPILLTGYVSIAALAAGRIRLAAQAALVKSNDAKGETADES